MKSLAQIERDHDDLSSMIRKTKKLVSMDEVVQKSKVP